MIRRLMLLLPLCLALTACGGDPLKAVHAALAKGDLIAAEKDLDAVVAEHPDLAAARMSRYVLYRHESLLGPPAKQAAYLQKSIEEYDWLAQNFKLALDYKDMDASLKNGAGTAVLFASAHKSIYGE